MFTEDDLRAALATRERFTPDAAAVLTGVTVVGHRLRRRRLAGASAAVVCAVAAAVAAPILLVSPQHTAPPTVPSPTAPVESSVDTHAADRPDFFVTVQPRVVAGYEIRSTLVGPDAQVATFVSDGSTEIVAEVSLHRPSARVDVGGFPGVHGVADIGAVANARVHGEPALYIDSDEARGVVWEYAPDSVAQLFSRSTRPLSGDVLVELAEGLVFIEPYPFPVPFRLDYLPANLIPLEARGGIGSAEVQFYGEFLLLNVAVARAELPGSDSASSNWFATTVGGRAARCVDEPDGRQCEVEFGADLVAIGAHGSGLAFDDLDRIVGGMRLADPYDPATWFPIDEAIPFV